VYRVRATGSVTPRRDRRKDLFEFKYTSRGDRDSGGLLDSPPIAPAPHLDWSAEPDKD
jgi:hypothetical protein